MAMKLKVDGLLYLEVPAPDTALHHENYMLNFSVFHRQMWRNLIDKFCFECIAEGELTITLPAATDAHQFFIARRK